MLNLEQLQMLSGTCSAACKNAYFLLQHTEQIQFSNFKLLHSKYLYWIINEHFIAVTTLKIIWKSTKLLFRNDFNTRLYLHKDILLPYYLNKPLNLVLRATMLVFVISCIIGHVSPRNSVREKTTSCFFAKGFRSNV